MKPKKPKLIEIEDEYGIGYKIECDDVRPLYRCTQCKVIRFTNTEGKAKGMLSCGCNAKP